MGVACQILINKPREGVHKAGAAVTGVVKYFIDERTAYQDVTLSLIGKGKCNWSEGPSDSSTEYYGTEDIIIRHVNVTNKKAEQNITLLPGEYHYPFEFYLPEDIPTSCKDKIGSIFYRIQIKFVKSSFFSFSRLFTTDITVYGSVRPPGEAHDGPVVFGLEKTIFALTGSKPVIQLKGEIAKTCLIPGDNVHLTYKVSNPTNVIISSVKTELYCYITYTSNCGRTNKNTVKVKGCSSESPSLTEKWTKVECVLGTLPELYSIQHSKVISKEYRVRVTMRLPLPHINATMEIPIVLGERAGQSSEHLGIQSLDDDEAEQPPSYWETMQEQKTDHKEKHKK